MERSNPKAWQATLTPHRSLSRQGFITVMALIVLVNLVVGGLFVAIGAWPVLGFVGLDVFLIWWAFKANFADAAKAERIRITEHELILERWTAQKEPEEQRFVRSWVRVELEEDPGRELIGRLSLVTGRERVHIGDFLAPGERRTLAQALKAALAIPHI